MFHAEEGWLRNRGEALTRGQLLFVAEQGWDVAEWFLPIILDCFTIRLFRRRNNYICTEQAIADAVALSGPCNTIIDDVGVYCPILTDLANLTVAGEDIASYKRNAERMGWVRQGGEGLSTGQPSN